MSLPGHVLCMWNKRLWPAKVLSRLCSCRLRVEICVLHKQIEVSVSDTRPLVLEELQAMAAVLAARPRRSIPTSDAVNYQRAVKFAVDLIEAQASSELQGPCAPCTSACEQRGKAKKECKCSPTAAEQNKTESEETGAKRADSDGAASTRAQEGPTTGNAALGNALNVQRRSRRRLLDEPGGGNALPSATQERKGAKPRQTQCRARVPGRSAQGPDPESPTESSETGAKKGNGLRGHKVLKHQMPDFEEEKGLSSSELSMDISSPEYPAAPAGSPPHDDTEEDIQLPVVMLQKEPAAIEPGAFVWCKFQHYPYWPSLVKLVDRKHKKVTVMFLEQSISDPAKKKSFKVSLRSIKPYDCPEKPQLLEIARKDYSCSVDWCDSLISDYRIRLGCGSFSGSFMDYCAADISLPVRRELESGRREVVFPMISSEAAEAEQQPVCVESPRSRKLLPDRARAARDRANERLVEFIVSDKAAESHLLDVLTGKKTSQWLKKFQSSNRGLNCLETYIEDEEQMELVVGYLQTLCERMSEATKTRMLGDQAQFIFEVLIPEAVIFAIAATEQISHENAKMKYLKGPSVTKRERRLFEEQILEKKRCKVLEEAKIKKDSRK